MKRATGAPPAAVPQSVIQRVAPVGAPKKKAPPPRSLAGGYGCGWGACLSRRGASTGSVSSLSVSSQRGNSVAARACEMMSARRIGISIETVTARITLETLLPRFEIARSFAAPTIVSEPPSARIPRLPLGEQRDRHLWSDLKPGSISRRPAGQGRVAFGLRTRRCVGLARCHTASWLSAPRNLRRRWQSRALRGTQPRALQRTGGRGISR
jgi:hypothetical protein